MCSCAEEEVQQHTENDLRRTSRIQISIDTPSRIQQHTEEVQQQLPSQGTRNRESELSFFGRGEEAFYLVFSFSFDSHSRE